MNCEYATGRHAAIIATAVMILLPGCASPPDVRHATTPGGTFAYWSAGRGAPAVVFEAGLGDGKETWLPVFAEVGRFTTAFAYDRGGHGASTVRSPDRSAKQIVEELRALLKAVQIEPPFVLVGHSIATGANYGHAARAPRPRGMQRNRCGASGSPQCLARNVLRLSEVR